MVANKQAYIDRYTRVQCSLAVMGLAQVRPNKISSLIKRFVS